MLNPEEILSGILKDLIGKSPDTEKQVRLEKIREYHKKKKESKPEDDVEKFKQELEKLLEGWGLSKEQIHTVISVNPDSAFTIIQRLLLEEQQELRKKQEEDKRRKEAEEAANAKFREWLKFEKELFTSCVDLSNQLIAARNDFYQKRNVVYLNELQVKKYEHEIRKCDIAIQNLKKELKTPKELEEREKKLKEDLDNSENLSNLIKDEIESIEKEISKTHNKLERLVGVVGPAVDEDRKKLSEQISSLTIKNVDAENRLAVAKSQKEAATQELAKHAAIVLEQNQIIAAIQAIQTEKSGNEVGLANANQTLQTNKAELAVLEAKANDIGNQFSAAIEAHATHVNSSEDSSAKQKAEEERKNLLLITANADITGSNNDYLDRIQKLNTDIKNEEERLKELDEGIRDPLTTLSQRIIFEADAKQKRELIQHLRNERFQLEGLQKNNSNMIAQLPKPEPADPNANPNPNLPGRLQASAPPADPTNNSSQPKISISTPPVTTLKGPAAPGAQPTLSTTGPNQGQQPAVSNIPNPNTSLNSGTGTTSVATPTSPQQTSVESATVGEKLEPGKGKPDQLGLAVRYEGTSALERWLASMFEFFDAELRHIGVALSQQIFISIAHREFKAAVIEAGGNFDALEKAEKRFEEEFKADLKAAKGDPQLEKKAEEDFEKKLATLPGIAGGDQDKIRLAIAERDGKIGALQSWARANISQGIELGSLFTEQATAMTEAYKKREYTKMAGAAIKACASVVPEAGKLGVAIVKTSYRTLVPSALRDYSTRDVRRYDPKENVQQSANQTTQSATPPQGQTQAQTQNQSQQQNTDKNSPNTVYDNRNQQRLTPTVPSAPPAEPITEKPVPPINNSNQNLSSSATDKSMTNSNDKSMTNSTNSLGDQFQKATGNLMSLQVHPTHMQNKNASNNSPFILSEEGKAASPPTENTAKERDYGLGYTAPVTKPDPFDPPDNNSTNPKRGDDGGHSPGR